MVAIDLLYEDFANLRNPDYILPLLDCSYEDTGEDPKIPYSYGHYLESNYGNGKIIGYSYDSLENFIVIESSTGIIYVPTTDKYKIK